MTPSTAAQIEDMYGSRIADLPLDERDQVVGLEPREEVDILPAKSDRRVDRVPVAVLILVELLRVGQRSALRTRVGGGTRIPREGTEGFAGKFSRSLTTYSGRRFTSVWISAMYSPMMPRI